MSSPVITITEGKTLLDASKLMDKHNIGSLVVVRDKKPVGILTERDIVRRVISKGKNPAKSQVKNFMTRKLILIDPETTFFNVSRMMYENYFRRLIVVHKGKLVGILTAKDLIRILSSN